MVSTKKAGALVSASRLVALVAAVGVLLTGCTEAGPRGVALADPGLPEQWNHPTTAPVSFEGTTVDGGKFVSRSLLGEVVVVNFWYAGCMPCRAEAPILKSLAAQYEDRGVAFVGINTRDDRATASLFKDTFKPGYPSIVDEEGDLSAQLAFSGLRGPGTTPSTLVLDRRGRVVARYGSQVNKSVLNTLIRDAITETSA